jgi:4,5-dihydroxyphthalate decarboxylase
MNHEKRLLPLTLAVGNYDRTRPLLDGKVRPRGIALKAESPRIGEFCLRPVYEEYDAAEMSLSWYVMARCRREPVIALPIFPLRMPIHPYLFCRADAPYTHPRDLVGKRVGTERYRLTVNLWARGILSDSYGITPNQFSWVTEGEEGAGFSLPPGVSVEIRPGVNMEDLLFDGEIDSLFSPIVPESFRRGDPRIRRLFPNCRAEFDAYFNETHIFPITHTVVMNEALWNREPWVAEELFTAFREAQRQCEDFYYADPKHLTLAGAIFILDEERRIFGRDPWAHGLNANAHVLEAFVRYAHEQGYISRVPRLEELFARNTLSL